MYNRRAFSFSICVFGTLGCCGTIEGFESGRFRLFTGAGKVGALVDAAGWAAGSPIGFDGINSGANAVIAGILA